MTVLPRMVLTLAGAIGEHRLPRLDIDDKNFLGDRKAHALLRLDRGLPLGGQVIPLVTPHTFHHMSEGFRQSMDLKHLEAERLHFRQDCGWWCRAGGHDFDRGIKLLLLRNWRIDQHSKHDRRTPQVRDAVLGDVRKMALAVIVRVQ